HRDLAQLAAQQAEPDAQRGESDAGDRKQKTGADRECMGVVAGIRRGAAGDEAIGAAERGGEDHQGADGENEPGMPPLEAADVHLDPEGPSDAAEVPEGWLGWARRHAASLT